MNVETTAGGVAMAVTVCLGKHGGRVIGNVTDAELTTLRAEADAMGVGLRKCLRGVTAAGTEVMVVVVAVVVVTVTEEETEGATGEGTEVPQPSSQGIGTAQTAVPTTLQVVKLATSAMRQSKCACHHCFCRLALWLAG